MQRRNFILESGITALGLAVFGNIRWSDGHYTGDSITTTDILGPFYRPGAPLRTNLNPPDFTGEILQVSGTIYQQDGKSPAAGCRVEIWQCKADGYYDNLSDDYNYRGHGITGKDGKYHFITTQPPAEPTDETKTVYRPAHIHLRICAEKQQDLITQVYFQGDDLLFSDPSTRSTLAINRILTVTKLHPGESMLIFDIVLAAEQTVDKELLHQVCGVYRMSNGSLMEFYADGDLLFYKTNGRIWGALSYRGPYSYTGMNTEANFAVGANGAMSLHFEFLRRRETKLDGVKILKYT